jgi:APA family basic amino acid/polyamine antiporter
MSARNAATEANAGLTQWSGAGLVIANMVGAGVLLSMGFMAQEMGPGPILVAWVLGGAIALSGAWAYGGIAQAIARSGGEYRYLSDLVHPLLGYWAGWGSFVLGFSTPIAIDAIAVGAFAATLTDALSARLVACAVIALLTATQTMRLSRARWAQNALLLVKIGFLAWFLLLGLAEGSHSWPSWEAPEAGPGFPWTALVSNQFWIAFAFSGWNAAIYAAGDFRHPRTQVPRAMWMGCGAVCLLYLLVNWVFVANLDPLRARAVFDYEETRVTLAHLIAIDLLGPTGGAVMSLLVIAALLSAMSAMMLAGPRVYAEMARDGFLPRAFSETRGRTPVFAVLAQGGVALVLTFTHTLLEAVQAASAFLMAFTALTAASLFRLPTLRPDAPAPGASRLLAAAIHAVSMAGILWIGLRRTSAAVWLAVGGVLLISTLFFSPTAHRLRAETGSGGSP